MNKATILAAVTAALALAASAEEKMEKCVINKNGKSLIKAHRGDCSTSKYSCAGQNGANDPEAWLFVPKGQCEKINAGDFSKISQTLKDKLSS